MTARLFLTPSIYTALVCIQDDIRSSKSVDPLVAVTIVVPDNDSGRFVRRTMGSQANVYVVTFRQLARIILIEEDNRPQSLDELTMRRLTSRLLKDMVDQGQLTSFESVSDKPGFTRELVRWLLEAKDFGLQPADYADYARKTRRGRDRQLADLFASYQRYLEDNNLEDGPGINMRAGEVLKQPSAHLSDRLKLVHFLGFDHFNPVQLSILARLAEGSTRLAIYLLWDDRQPSQSLALSRLRTTKTKLEAALGLSASTIERKEPASATLEDVQHRLFGPKNQSTAAGLVEGLPALVAVAAPSREREVRWTLRRIKQLQLQGVPAADIVILAPKIDVYRPLVKSIAWEYGMAVDITSPLAEIPAAAALINLLELWPELPWRQTLDALRSPYFSNPWLSAEQIHQLELLTRERPVIKGWDQWRSALGPIVQKGSSALAAKMPASELEAIELGLGAFFGHIRPDKRWSYREWADWLRTAIFGQLSGDPRDGAGLEEKNPSLQMISCCEESPVPDEDLEALAKVSLLLESLITANKRVPSAQGNAIPWEIFRSEFIEALRESTISTANRVPGVIFRELSAARALAVPYLFVLGLAEGEFPRKRRADVFYADEERNSPEFPLEQAEPGEDACLWWQVISCVQKTLFLLRPWIDERGVRWLPSPYYSAVQDLLTGLEITLGVEEKPSVDEAASRSELMAAMAGAGVESAPFELFHQWDAIQRARKIIALRRGWGSPGKYEGVFESLDLIDELGQRFGPRQRWSASSLNRYGNCPYGFFAEQVLGLQEISDPEEGFDAMQRGSLLHEVLEALYRKLTDRNLPPTRPNLEQILNLLEKTCDKVFEVAPHKFQFRPTPLWTYEQEELRRLLRALVTWECENNGDEAQYKPRFQELGFGFSWSTLSALSVTDSGGTQFSIRGFIDRIDIDDDGNARILDYKSGRGTIPKSDILRGLAFQTPLYALAAAGLFKEITQVTESAYLHIPLRQTSGELSFTGPVAEDDIIKGVVDRAGVIVQRIRSGIFPSAPGKPEAGSGLCRAQCGFAGICRVSRVSISKARQNFT